jgi:hypothetical protein
MGDIEFGKCDICRKTKELQREYYYYPLPCECCSNQHFEIVRHCNECEPVEPPYTRPMLRTKSMWMFRQNKWYKQINWPAVITWTVVGFMVIFMALMGMSIVKSIIEQL